MVSPGEWLRQGNLRDEGFSEDDYAAGERFAPDHGAPILDNSSTERSDAEKAQGARERIVYSLDSLTLDELQVVNQTVNEIIAAKRVQNG